MRILIVDDSETNRTIAQDCLCTAGYDTDIAEDGIVALRKLRADEEDKTLEYDAVILDIMMPVVDGSLVLEKIRQKWSSVQLPVIMLTGKEQIDDIVKSLESGANDYVTKPLNREILLARIGVHLSIKQRHEELRIAQKALVNAAKIESIGLLAAGVAHEIRNPLGQIQMAATGLESLLESIDEDQKKVAESALSTIIDAVEKADEIVVELMKASAEQPLVLAESDLNDEIRDCLEVLQPTIDQDRITLKTEFERGPLTVLVAKVEFQQAMVEVVENAIQAIRVLGMPTGTLTIRTETTIMQNIGPNDGTRTGRRLRNGDKAVVLHIEDTGPGIPSHLIDSVFDAFVTTKATGSGTGLGLTVARKIVELHQGLIRLEQRQDVPSGLRVSIYLPAARQSLTQQ